MTMGPMMSTLVENFVAALVFAGLGVLLFVLAFVVFDRITPGSVWKELLEDQNVALGNLMAGIAIALAIIIAAAIH
jgi:putative membrane protein